MRKTIFTLLLSLLATLSASAGDKYTVFLVRGNVTALINGKVQPLNPQDAIDESIIINVGKNAYLILKSTSKKRITLTASRPFRGSVKQLKRLPGAKQKHSQRFMLAIEGKTATDFVDSRHRVMSRGGFTSRDLFEDDEEETRAEEELHTMLLKAGFIDR